MKLRSTATMSARRVTAGVRDHRETVANLAGELRVALRGVGAHHEDGDVVVREGLSAVTQRLEFLRSASGEGQRKPGQHVGAGVREVRCAVLDAAGAHEQEVRCRIAHGQLCGQHRARYQRGQQAAYEGA